MKQQSWLKRTCAAMTSMAFLAVMVMPAYAAVVLKRGTDVKLAFDNALSSKTAQVGQVVHLHVIEPVIVDGRTVIKPGTEVTGTVAKVSKRKRYGINAKIQFQMSRVRLVTGQRAMLGFKTKGRDVSGRTGGAAAATIGGAVLLGPIGLVGGLFIPGKAVNVKPGDKMTCQIDNDVIVRGK